MKLNLSHFFTFAAGQAFEAAIIIGFLGNCDAKAYAVAFGLLSVIILIVAGFLA